MAKFSIPKKIELEDLGKGSYLTFTIPSYRDVKKIMPKISGKEEADLAELAIKFLSDHFEEGEINTKKVNKEDIEDLPLPVINYCFEEITKMDFSKKK